MAGGIGAVWLLAVRPAAGLEPPTSPGLAIAEFLLVGLIAGYLVFLQLRRLLPRFSPTDDYLSRACTSTAAGVWILDDQLRTVWSNESMRKILGEVPPPGKLPFTYLNYESRALLEEQFEARREGKSDTYWVTLKIAGGEERRALVCGSPIMDSEKGFLGSIGVFIDMTEILAQRERLAEEERLNTIGAIVDRLDHKLNNALMVIRGQAEVFLRREPEGPNSQGLNRIIEQVDVINNELKALGELKKIETEPYYGDHLMLSIPEKEEEPPEIS